MTFIPDNIPGRWDILVLRGATWPGTTISATRDGVAIIPTTAVLTVHDTDGNQVINLSATINGATGEMTVPSISASVTTAYTWSYGNLLFRISESTIITDLLAGNATCVNRSD